MESFTPYLFGACVAVLVGLDRTAALQIMISRPLVAGPMVGVLLGDVMTGLTVGMLLELLWLSRMPVGVNILHDDTQVAVGATTLSIALTGTLGNGPGLIFCSLLVALPLGKIGQSVERMVRKRNQLLTFAAQRSLASGKLPSIGRLHLFGLVHFALGALLTYFCIVLFGRWAILFVAPYLMDQLTVQSAWLKLAIILVGSAALLQSLNVRRAYTLYFGGFFFTSFWLYVL